MKRFHFVGLFVTLLCSLICVTACSDDDSDVDIETYITGKWHSYKAVFSANNKSASIDITKTGMYSQLYIELTFKDDNTITQSYYKVDQNQMSRWITEQGTYVINGDVITIYDSEGATDCFVDGKSLYVRSAGDVEDIGYTTAFIYFKK